MDEQYELTCYLSNVLGLSPYAVVYEGSYGGVPVAVKKIAIDSFKNRQLMEVRTLDHENVVKVLTFGDVKDVDSLFRVLVLELCFGTLSNYFYGPEDILPKKPMPESMDALIQMSIGLEFLHSKNLLHKSIKPGNVLVSVNKHGKVVLKISQDSLMYTESVAVKTPHTLESLNYWPPEMLQYLDDKSQLRESMQAACDVFSLGCIFYGYITKGKHPFGKGVYILHQIVIGKFQLADITNHPAVEVIREMIQTNPTSRPVMSKVVVTLTGLSRNKSVTEPVFKTRSLVSDNEQPQHARYISGYRVNRCTDFYSQRGCKDLSCFDYHQANQRRRRSFLKTDGFNYSGNIVCQKYNAENGKCPDGDDCPFLHENVGKTERRYHLCNYKTELCASKNCIHPQCSFAHGKSDLRVPPKFNRVPNENVRKAANVPKVEIAAEWKDPKFVIHNYKTQPCSSTYDCCPRKLYCPYYHSYKDRRRSLTKFSYWVDRCFNVFDQGTNEWKEASSCQAGDSCRSCHNGCEFQYHALTYKTADCAHKKSGTCIRDVLCAFAHSDSEKRKPKQLRKDATTPEELMELLQL